MFASAAIAQHHTALVIAVAVAGSKAAAAA
jgi:hypothetical protein